MATLLAQIMDDLCTRFVINIQDEEIEDPIRVFFVLEQAHWYYEDFFRKQHTTLPRMSLRDFALTMFKHYKPFHRFKGQIDDIYAAFKRYKKGVPVCGALLINAACTKVLMVRGWGINVWSIPKGKINENEVLMNCAIREVEEETGYNFASLADPNASIEITQEKKPMTLFIVVGVPEEYPFAPLSRNEVSEIKFVKISKLVDPASAKKLNTANMIPSIIGRLKAWLGTASGKETRRRAMQRAGLTAPQDEPSPLAAAAAPPAAPTTNEPQSLNALLRALQQGGGPAVPLGSESEPSNSQGVQPTPPSSVERHQQEDVFVHTSVGQGQAQQTRGAPSLVNFSFDVPVIMQAFARCHGAAVR